MTPDQLRSAVDMALAGECDEAHGIVQADEADPTACWIHAVLHKIDRLTAGGGKASPPSPKPAGKMPVAT